jgi:hypothetical protein
MDRRGFLRSLVGGVAVGAAVRTWPFRVYSFPPVPDRIDQVDLKYWGVDWGSGETSTVWYVHPSQAAWKDLGGIAYYTPELGTQSRSFTLSRTIICQTLKS